MTTEPEGDKIATPDDLGNWHEWLSVGGEQAAILDAHGRPRLMSEGEDGVLYVTNPYAEDNENIWTKAEVELWAYGPFTVLHPRVGGAA